MSGNESDIQQLLDMEEAKEELETRIHEFRERFEGKGKKVIAVLGSFDTWPFIDTVSRLVAKKGHAAVTSLRIYFKKKGKIYFEKRPEEFESIFMRDSLKLMIEKEAHKAVIIYSVPAAHYIETEWCFNRLEVDSTFEVYGIALVREINAKEQRDNNKDCIFLEPEVGLDSTWCRAKTPRTAWKCVKRKGFCPFIKQQVAKNVIEYFFLSPRMKLYALERLDILSELLDRML